jgi:hypothetical protein
LPWFRKAISAERCALHRYRGDDGLWQQEPTDSPPRSHLGRSCRVSAHRPERSERPSHPPAQTETAVKLQVQFDLLGGALHGPILQDGRAHDRRALHQTEFPAGALRLADLGSFSVEAFAT